MKYDTKWHAALHALAQAGADAETGDDQRCGGYAWRFKSIDGSDICATARIDLALSDADIAECAASCREGVIIVEDSMGFVHVHSAANSHTARSLTKCWETLQTKYETAIRTEAAQ